MATADQGWLDVSSVTPRVGYTASSGQTTFAVPFTFLNDGHLLVYQNDALVPAADYVVTGEDDEDGGQIVLDTGATLSDSIVIERDVPYELTTHVPPSGPLNIPALNLQLSLFAQMIQQLDVDRVRSLQQPDSDVDDLDDLPVAADRAGKYLYFNVTTGQPEVVAAVSTSVPASAFMLTLMDDTTAAAARATLGITDQSAYAGLSNWHHCR